MKGIHEGIIYTIIGLLFLSVILLYINQQKIYNCQKNLNNLASIIIKNYEILENEDSNGYIRVELPESYNYIIYYDNEEGVVKIKDLDCNIGISLNKEIKIRGEILSKSDIYIIKNGSQIYLSPNIEDNIDYYNKSILEISGDVDNKKQNISQTSTSNVETVIVFFRQAKVLGNNKNIITYDSLKAYATKVFEEFKDFGKLSFYSVDDLKDTNKYGLYISKKVLYSDILNSQEVAYTILRELKNIKDTYPNAKIIIAIFVWEDKNTHIGGYSLIEPSKNIFILNIINSYGFDIEKIFYISINKALDDSYKIPLHEFGHDAGLLFDQYINGCSYTIVRIYNSRNPTGEIYINYFDYLNSISNNKLSCNKLSTDSGASLTEHSSKIIDEIYNTYGESLLLALNKSSIEDMKNSICVGDNYNGIMLIKTKIGQGLITLKNKNVYLDVAIVYLNNKDRDYIINPESECFVIYSSDRKNILVESCKSYFYRIYGSLINLYNQNIGFCLANYDITGQSRDIMGNSNLGYYSTESITAFKNNYNEIWK